MIYYYSRFGKTKIFAEALGEVLGQNVRELESDLNKKSFFGFMIKALSLAFSGKSYPVLNMPDEIPGEVFLCAPVWGGKLAAPPKFFLENAKLSDTTVNMLLTASIPHENYKNDALKYLELIPCKAGRVLIFATQEKAMPEKDAVLEQMREML